MIFYFLLIYIIGISAFVGFKVFKWWRYRKIRLRTLILHDTLVYEEKNVVVGKDEELLIDKTWKPKAKGSAIFTKKGNPSKKLIIFPYNKEEPVQFKNPEKGEIDEFTRGWGRNEALEFLKKHLVKGKAEFRPISRLEFIVLCILIIINIIIVIGSKGGFRL